MPGTNRIAPLDTGFQKEPIALDLPLTSTHDAATYRFAEGSKWLRIELTIKRAFDVVFAILLILLLSPMLTVVAVCVRFTSKGPAIFRQQRWGWQEQRFVCFKFRSMHVDQAGLIGSQRLSDAKRGGVLVKTRNDPRVTRVGAFIRKTSIDELPQLFNVLKGDMSFVGPRPLVLHMLDPYPELRKVRSLVRPGITGRWQISARNQNLSALQMEPYDLDYIAHFSLWLDLRILLRTPAAVLFHNEAF